jgi:preprotein translocase subunit SecA
VVPLNDIPADYRDAISQAFVDGVRLFRDRSVLIQTVDQFWVRHLTDLDELREGIGLRAYAQRDPLVAYRTEASNTYAELLDSIRQQVAQHIFNIQFTGGPAPRQQRQRANGAVPASSGAANGGTSSGAPAKPATPAQSLQRTPARSVPLRTTGGSEAAKPAPVKVASKKVGRNDVCPFCDSGKKVKHCNCEGARKFRGES